MIQKYIDRFIEQEKKIKEEIGNKLDRIDMYDYKDFAKWVIELISFKEDDPSSESMETFILGAYQGDFIFFMHDGWYCPDKVWIMSCSFGSCSGCDTLESIRNDGLSDKEKIRAYSILMLNLIESLKEIEY
jgi:hypothetical protein